MYIINKLKTTCIIGLCILSFSGFSQNSKFKVTLDAGHGAHDFGAVYKGHVEKNIALSVVLKVGKILESQPNFEVNYTRKTDVFIGLVERANIANRVDANIFVSIHCNANKNTAAFGTETFVMGMSKNASNLAAAKKENEVVTLEKDYKQKYEGFDPNSPETLIGLTLMQEDILNNSISLAAKIEDFIGGLSKKSRGISQAPFMVLHKAYMTRVLIEMGFISNPAEGDRLDSEEGQNEIANAIADAIISYKKEYFGNGAIENDEDRPSKKIIERPVKDTTTPAKKEEKIVKELVKKETSKEIKKEPTKKEPIKEVVKESAVKEASVVFKVQIAASSKKMDLVPTNFNGLNNIDVESNGAVYKYSYGQTSDYSEAKKNLAEAKEKGYNSAFLIAFKNGKSISVKEAIK
jgi:N-acetylmuramoyl-L-alanine amidase